jgi:hypothetical protein
VTKILTWGAFTLVNRAYRLVFNQPAAQRVLADLAEFCHANRPTMVRDSERMTAFNEGKRAVWLRIQQRVRLTDDDLFAIMGGHDLPPKE